MPACSRGTGAATLRLSSKTQQILPRHPALATVIHLLTQVFPGRIGTNRRRLVGRPPFLFFSFAGFE
jgi:hypothetical protein